MPAATPNRGYPYPLGNDPLAVAAHIEALARAVDLDVGDYDQRLDIAESDITVLENGMVVQAARTNPSGTRNRHQVGSQITAFPGTPMIFEIVDYQQGLLQNPTNNGWQTTAAGVFAISWQCQLDPGWYTEMRVNGSTRSRSALADADGWSWGSWTGFVPLNQSFTVHAMHVDGSCLYDLGWLDIWRVAEGG